MVGQSLRTRAAPSPGPGWAVFMIFQVLSKVLLILLVLLVLSCSNRPTLNSPVIWIRVYIYNSIQDDPKNM